MHQLINEESATISLGHSDVAVNVFDNASKIFLSSTVYFGGNFISKSVRNCLNKKPPFTSHNGINTTFTVDEENFRVTINYLGGLEHLNKRMFIDLLEEFSQLADDWRLYLDEHDKHDLVHVTKPK